MICSELMSNNVDRGIINSRSETYTIPPVWCRIRRLMLLLGLLLPPAFILKVNSGVHASAKLT